MTRNTVSISLNDEDYQALKKLAEREDRYISGQARHMLRAALHPKLPPAAHQDPTSATSAPPEFIGQGGGPAPSKVHIAGPGLPAEMLDDAGIPRPALQPEVPTRAGKVEPEEGPSEAELRSPTRTRGVPGREPLPG